MDRVFKGNVCHFGEQKALRSDEGISLRITTARNTVIMPITDETAMGLPVFSTVEPTIFRDGVRVCWPHAIAIVVGVRFPQRRGALFGRCDKSSDGARGRVKEED